MKNIDSISKLEEIVRQFCSDRDWDQFHSQKDLAIGIVTEAAELLDLFRFKTNDEIALKIRDEKFKEKIEHELADIFFFVLRFGQMNNIDISQALSKKLLQNAEKYPIDRAKGSNKKYNEE
tara:strand:- start:34160 stop:34522 length:363 start_codon:yes stop_codon:yes gene_type:complete